MSLRKAFCSEEGKLTKRIINALEKHPDFAPCWRAASEDQQEVFIKALFDITTCTSKQTRKRKITAAKKPTKKSKASVVKKKKMTNNSTSSRKR